MTDLIDLGTWGTTQWTAAVSALGAIATAVATVYAAKAARAAERSVEAQFRPQIVLKFVERDGNVYLQMLNAGGPAQSITIESEPPLANSENLLLTDRPKLEYGVSILLPHGVEEFFFDGLYEYFGLHFLFHGRPVDFNMTIRAKAAMLDEKFVSHQTVTLRPLIPRSPKMHRGLGFAVQQVERWAASDPSQEDLTEQDQITSQLTAAANDQGVGYLKMTEMSNVDMFLQHIGWRIDARYMDGRLLVAGKVSGTNHGDRIAAGGWSPMIALIRLAGFGLSVNQEGDPDRP